MYADILKSRGGAFLLPMEEKKRGGAPAGDGAARCRLKRYRMIYYNAML